MAEMEERAACCHRLVEQHQDQVERERRTACERELAR